MGIASATRAVDFIRGGVRGTGNKKRRTRTAGRKPPRLIIIIILDLRPRSSSHGLRGSLACLMIKHFDRCTMNSIMN